MGHCPSPEYNERVENLTSEWNQKPEVSDETGALLVYSRFITFKSFSHRPTSIEHAELLGM